jgi:type III secretion protein W
MADLERLGHINITLEAMKEVQKETTQELRAEQNSSALSFKEASEEVTNPFAARYATKRTDIKSRSDRLNKMLKAQKMGKMLPIERIRDSASRFQQRNPELKSKVLEMLRDKIKEGDSKEDVLKTLKEFYEDVSLMDEALEFLLETTEGDLAKVVQEAKNEINQQFGREIVAGRNVSDDARAAEGKGIGDATNLRDMYRDITGNPRDSTTMFEELSKKYSFKELKAVIDFLLHSLGSDLKAKGPSIPHGLLHNLMTETRSLQAILGVYRFFRGRMNLMHGLFLKNGLNFPSHLNFEVMTKQFMNIVSDRYPSSQKVLQSAGRLGIEKWIRAKIIVFSQLRDAIREVAMGQIYKSLQHRDEVLMAIIEALEELEDELEELEEEGYLEDEDDDDDDEGGSGNSPG